MMPQMRRLPTLRLGPTDDVPFTAIDVLMLGIHLRDLITARLKELGA